VSGVFLFYQGVENGVDENEKHGYANPCCFACSLKMFKPTRELNPCTAVSPFFAKEIDRKCYLELVLFRWKKVLTHAKRFRVGRSTER
jgi:hypothetical protein